MTVPQSDLQTHWAVKPQLIPHTDFASGTMRAIKNINARRGCVYLLVAWPGLGAAKLPSVSERYARDVCAAASRQRYRIKLSSLDSIFGKTGQTGGVFLN
jgi:hypothetical protein